MPHQIVREIAAKSLYASFAREHGVAVPAFDGHAWTFGEPAPLLTAGTSYVIKVDNGIKGRGKRGMILFFVAEEWDARVLPFAEQHREQRNFYIEPVMEVCAEHYLCFVACDDHITVIYSASGGVDVGSVTQHSGMTQVNIPWEWNGTLDTVCEFLQQHVACLCRFIEFMKTYHFVYMEMNPTIELACGSLHPLDFACKIDDTALFLFDNVPNMCVPSAASRADAIARLDAQTGASLKFQLLNPDGRIWTLVAGGGASVAYTDEIARRGHFAELGNYGEYSGNPPENFVYEYASEIFSLAVRSASKDLVFYVGGAIANFTQVDTTLRGIARAVRAHADALRDKCAAVYVRRGGPGYKQGLRYIEDACVDSGVRCAVFGPEVPLTHIVDITLPNVVEPNDTEEDTIPNVPDTTREPMEVCLTGNERVVLLGFQPAIVQRMLDFDYACGKTVREVSLVGIVDPTRNERVSREAFFFGSKSVLLCVYPSYDAFLEHKKTDADVIVNVLSFRKAVEGARACVGRCVTTPWRLMFVMAEGVPELWTRELVALCARHGHAVVGPATVGGVVAGGLRLANAGGALDGMAQVGLLRRPRRGCAVGIVTRSGGLLNELCNVVHACGLDVHTAVSIGGDRVSGVHFVDWVRWMLQCSDIDVVVVLGEMGGVQEYEVIRALGGHTPRKPVVAYCLGTSADAFAGRLDAFGHAGAFLASACERAAVKNDALRRVGCCVPRSFSDISHALRTIASVMCGVVDTTTDTDTDTDVRVRTCLQKRTQKLLYSDICDERTELAYAGRGVSEMEPRIVHALARLWFRRDLPAFAADFFERALFLLADHGPGVSGAINTIVAARAGKDVASSLCAGLLTVGPRFGGAIQDACRGFWDACVRRQSAREFVDEMGRANRRIAGIGHRVKSKDNPDVRVASLLAFVRAHVKHTRVTDFALAVEALTTRKKHNLILNIDGLIAAAFCDVMAACGYSNTDIQDLIDTECLNGIFLLGRTVGFIGHYIEQKRLRQGLFRLTEEHVEYLDEDGDS